MNFEHPNMEVWMFWHVHGKARPIHGIGTMVVYNLYDMHWDNQDISVYQVTNFLEDIQ